MSRSYPTSRNTNKKPHSNIHSTRGQRSAREQWRLVHVCDAVNYLRCMFHRFKRSQFTSSRNSRSEHTLETLRPKRLASTKCVNCPRPEQVIWIFRLFGKGVYLHSANAHLRLLINLIRGEQTKTHTHTNTSAIARGRLDRIATNCSKSSGKYANNGTIDLGAHTNRQLASGSRCLAQSGDTRAWRITN